MFEILQEADERGELLLVNGGMCHWHKRRDGQITIREIIVNADKRGQGIGSRMLESLKTVEGAVCILAKCPTELESNVWYLQRGFKKVAIEETKSGRRLNVWKLELI